MIRLVWGSRGILVALLIACNPGAGSPSDAESAADAMTPAVDASQELTLAPGTAAAIFAGGCFWCMEPPFDALEGVVSTTSGYVGGSVAEPTYAQVSSGKTGHLEAVRIVYQPAVVTYAELLDVFWRNVDPLDAGGQFCDRGEQYTTAIFALDAEQRAQAEASKRKLETEGRFARDIVTDIRDGAPFYAAEEYHQDFYQKNPLRYGYYRRGCGRDARLEELWGADADPIEP